VKRIFVLWVLAIAVLFTAGGAQAASNPQTFTDPVGDSGNAPDITSVLVANNSSRQLTFRVSMTGLDVPSDTRVLVAIDSDRNASTGREGTDYLLIYRSDGEAALARWDGSEFVETPESTLTTGRDKGSVFFSVNADELGNTSGFYFWVRTLVGGEFAAAHEDNAPDNAPDKTFEYVLGPSVAPQLTLTQAHATKARAGKPFIAVVRIDRSDGVPMDLTLDDLTCRATARGHVIRLGFADADGPDAGCLWNLSKKSKGQVLRASVTIRLDGATITKKFTAKIK
jgi:hypothetical protein